MAQEEDKVQRIWMMYFENLFNINTQEEVAIHMYDFDGILRGRYFGEEPIGRAEVEVRVRKLKNGKVAGKDEMIGEIIKGGGDRVVDWIWRLCDMAFESGVVPEDWISAVIVALYNGKGERTECKNYRGIRLLSVVGKIYAGILVDRVHRVTGCLIDGGQGVFRLRKGCVDQIFTLKQIGEKAQEEKHRVYVGFIDWE